MQPSAPETMSATMLDAPGSAAVLRLVVRNHPGVMSHVCGLFARRGFNVDGIVCLPIGDTTRSVILLVVNEDDRLEQLIRQLGKLEDVLDVRRAPEAQTAFAAVARWMDSVTGLAPRV
jgi:acetolactate synthase-1/3 small subunit